MYGGAQRVRPENAQVRTKRVLGFNDRKTEPGGHSSKSQKGRCRESESFLKNDNSYKYLERLKGLKFLIQLKLYQKRF